MRQTDRLFYSADPDEAYADNPHGIGYKATISAPHMHAHCLELLKDQLKPGSKVLDVGCGSGYLSACFARMVGKGGKVIGIDYIKPLVDLSTSNILKDDPNLFANSTSQDGLKNVEIKLGDGWKGDTGEAPFDAIHVGAAAESLPQALIDQLKVGGRMIIPVGTNQQELLQVDKHKDGSISQKTICGVIYVPLVKKGN